MRVGLAAQRPPNQSTHLGLGRLPGRASEISQPLWYLANSFASVFLSPILLITFLWKDEQLSTIWSDKEKE